MSSAFTASAISRKDIATIFNELGVAGFVYFADNDKSGEDGASNLSTRLHEAHWPGDQDYRKFEGPGIPDKGDANDLLCHHFPDISQARTALAALPRFSTSHKATDGTYNHPGRLTTASKAGMLSRKPSALPWALALKTSNRKGFQQEYSAALNHGIMKTKHRAPLGTRTDSITCFGCGETLNAKHSGGATRYRLARPAQAPAADHLLARTSTWMPPLSRIQAEQTPLSFDERPGYLAEAAH